MPMIVWDKADESARRLRWQWRRWQAQRRWGAEALRTAPRLFGNAIPKSGSHLLHQILQGFADIGPFVVPGMPPVNRDATNRKHDWDEVAEQLRQMQPGDIRYGYLPAKHGFVEILTSPGWASMLIYRDPRDVAVSLMHYITDRQLEHDFHQVFREQLTTPKARLRAIIKGMDLPHSHLRSTWEQYVNYLPWLEHPEVLPVRFEDLVLNRRETLGRILDFVQQRGGWQLTLPREQALDALEAAIRPQRSGTFRKGLPGEWKDWFDDELKQLFKEETRDLLIRLGYEQDNDW